MAERKHACVVHVPADMCDVEAVVQRLKSEGLDVNVIGVSAHEAEAIQAGKTAEISAEAQACLDDADIIVVVISNSTEKSGEVEAILTEAQNHKNRIVGVWGGRGAGVAPQAVRDYGDSLVRVDSDSFHKAVCGRGRVWEGPQGTRVPPPKKKHQKCQ